MKNCYLKAIKLNDSYGMYNLGFYYQHVEKDYELMNQYYLMAVKLHNKRAIEICCDNNYFYNNTIKMLCERKL